jgi:hypothetical protein
MIADDLTKDRGETYGSPSDNHQRTAKLWTAYLLIRPSGELLTPEDVCMMNILQKISRAQHGARDIDTILDIQGYAQNILEIWDEA